MNSLNIQERVNSFVRLGTKIKQLTEEEIDQLYLSASGYNNWFTRESIKSALNSIAMMLEEKKLMDWINQYHVDNGTGKTIALVMAGNIPAVGFHDYMCVLLAGHKLLAKLSSQDPVLPVYLHKLLVTIENRFESLVEFTEERLSSFDAIIATGSDNSARYFEYYFSKYPHIIRKNRTSVGVIHGNETDEQLKKLGYDVFNYYGLGCRNVSKILIPENYDLSKLLDQWSDFNFVLDHHKYSNNYDYNKSIYLVNRVAHLDTGYLLIKEDSGLVSPISTLFYEFYSSEDELMHYLERYEDKIQCIVGDSGYWQLDRTVEFGTGQCPGPEDYADGVDVMHFLSKL